MKPIIPALFALSLTAAFFAIGDSKLAISFRKSMPALLLQTEFTFEDLAAKYGKEKVKILIVAGHDDKTVGTYYRGLSESSLTLSLSKKLGSFFRADSNFETFILRDESGYSEEFEKYYLAEKSRIILFRRYFMKFFELANKIGLIEKKRGIEHNTAQMETALRLYGINKWAFDRQIDIILHVHFNDYRKTIGETPKYSGFAIYYPETQLPNHEVSRPLAQSVYNELKKNYIPSNLPLEQKGLIASDDLIAIGSNGSLDSAALLIEYAYIYEPHVINEKNRDAVFSDFAEKTYNGIKLSLERSRYEPQ